MEPFVKINYEFTKPIYAVTEGLKTFTGVDKRGIDYKKIWSPEPEVMYNILPKNVWEDFHLTIMTINREIPPHTDSDISTTINFYIETDNCKTVYYEPIVNDLESFQIENQTDGFIYKKEQLKEIASFVAKPMEVWLLNVKKIHSVESDKKEPFRKAVTLGTKKYNFEEVIDMLKVTGHL
ncbi:hypothetical protein EBU71_00895 [bacterium]|nr:hypothetical protein [Candidatus Elulimicrobium humile]